MKIEMETPKIENEETDYEHEGINFTVQVSRLLFFFTSENVLVPIYFLQSQYNYLMVSNKLLENILR